MEKNKFYKILPLNQKFYKLEKITLSSYESKKNITFHKKINTNDKNENLNTNSIDKTSLNQHDKKIKNEKNKKIKNEKYSIEKLKIIKNKKQKSNNKLFSTVDNFNILNQFLTTVKFKRITALFKKLKKFKKIQKHIFFYIKKNKIYLNLKDKTFNNGIVLLKSLVSHRLNQHEHSKKIKQFYTLLFAK